MKNIVLLFALLLGWNSVHAHSKESNPLITPEHFLEMASIIKTETTQKEWSLFCGITQQPNDYYFLEETKVLSLSWDEALRLTAWLVDNQKDQGYLAQILQEIDECPAPTADQIANLCRTVRFYEKDEAADGIGYTYHRSLWSMACTVPKVDPTEVGREKVRRMWAKHKENIRCEVGGGSRSEDLNIAKFAIDSTNHRFASELVIAYKCDFNFVDKKDGMTLLDFVQSRIDEEKRLNPPAENKIRDYENLYRAIVRNGGKHAKDL